MQIRITLIIQIKQSLSTQIYMIIIIIRNKIKRPSIPVSSRYGLERETGKSVSKSMWVKLTLARHHKGEAYWDLKNKGAHRAPLFIATRLFLTIGAGCCCWLLLLAVVTG